MNKLPKELKEEIINFDITDWDENNKHNEFQEFLDNNPYFDFHRLPTKETNQQRTDVYYQLYDYWMFEPEFSKNCHICKKLTNSYIHSEDGHCIKCMDCYKN